MMTNKSSFIGDKKWQFKKVVGHRQRAVRVAHTTNSKDRLFL